MTKYAAYIYLTICMAFSCGCKEVSEEKSSVQLIENTLHVNAAPFVINGINWNYRPIGHNYEYNLWGQSDEKIRKVLDTEMTMLQDMGVNTLRLYTGIPPKWIIYIHEKHNIYTMINHSFGRYGIEVKGEWIANTDYADTQTIDALMSEVSEMVDQYQETPGLLGYILGNENNYGLFWKGSETENIPTPENLPIERAKALYVAFEKATLLIKSKDTSLPVAICNGDLMFLELLNEECPSMDILAVNVYRGVSFGDLFKDVKKYTNKPLMLTEFGADAFDNLNQKEDQASQANYLLGNWKEIYQNSENIGGATNSIGGFTFQFSDGWWKTGQTINLDKHDSLASWENGGYKEDYVKGKNNINEEWFGICAKELDDSSGAYTLVSRSAYYTLQKIHAINLFDTKNSYASLEEVFIEIKNNTSLNKNLENINGN